MTAVTAAFAAALPAFASFSSVRNACSSDVLQVHLLRMCSTMRKLPPQNERPQSLHTTLGDWVISYMHHALSRLPPGAIQPYSLIQRHTALYEHTAIQHHYSIHPIQHPSGLRWTCLVACEASGRVSVAHLNIPKRRSRVQAASLTISWLRSQAHQPRRVCQLMCGLRAAAAGHHLRGPWRAGTSCWGTKFRPAELLVGQRARLPSFTTDY